MAFLLKLNHLEVFNDEIWCRVNDDAAFARNGRRYAATGTGPRDHEASQAEKSFATGMAKGLKCACCRGLVSGAENGTRLWWFDHRESLNHERCR